MKIQKEDDFKKAVVLTLYSRWGMGYSFRERSDESYNALI